MLKGVENPNGKPLKYHWKVLRGHEDKIKFKPLEPTGAVVGITIPYHKRYPISEGSKMATNRVDIGVFVENEYHLSAPAFISFYFPDNEKRVYDDSGRILSIDYQDKTMRKNYADPMIIATRDWRDEFRYDADRKLKVGNEFAATGKRSILPKEDKLFPGTPMEHP